MKSTLAMALIFLLAPMAPLRAAEDPDRWGAHLADDIDWVAVVWDWDAAEELTGNFVSYIAPIESLYQRSWVGGPVMIAAKRKPDGTTQMAVFLLKLELRPETIQAAKAFPTGGKPAPVEAGKPRLFANDDLLILGDPELVKPKVAADAPLHPLADLLLDLPKGAVLGFACRPGVVVPKEAGANALKVLGQSKRLAFGLGARGKAAEGKAVLHLLAAVGTDQVETQAGVLRDAARDYVKDRLRKKSRPGPEERMLVGLLARVTVSAQKDGDAGKAFVRADVDLAAGELPVLLASHLTFANPRAVVDAFVFAHRTGRWSVYLATFVPTLRSSGMRDGSIKQDELVKRGDRDPFYVIEKVYEEKERAEYRLRIQTPAGDKTLKDLQLILLKGEQGWTIHGFGPYVPVKK